MIINLVVGLAIIASALLFAYPIILFRKIYSLENRDKHRVTWFFLTSLCVTFFVGYGLAAAFILGLRQEVTPTEVLFSAFLLGGSVFVSVVARIFHQMVFSLDSLVQERTSELQKVYVRALETEHEAQRLKDHFIFVAAHEIRTPVTAMRWCLELISDIERHKLSMDEMRSVVAKLEYSLSNLIGLVDDLLDTSRLEYGTIKLHIEPCLAGQVLDVAVNLIRPVAVKEGISLTVDCGDLGGQEIRADRRRVGEVLTNLISNSIKFTAPGGHVGVKLSRRDDDFVISVSDNGVGLDESDMELLFKKFSRPDNHPEGKMIQSTGLGLYIAKTIVERWGGRIWAESPGRGKGSTFIFSIPSEPDL